MPPARPGKGQRIIPIKPLPFRSSSQTSASPAGAGAFTAESSAGPLAPTIAGANFLGQGLSFPGFPLCGGTDCEAPPDTDGAAGRTQYVQLVNTAFTVFDKTTHTVLAGPTSTNNLWSTLPASNPCNSTNDGDGIVLYDHLADRWIISQLGNTGATSGPYYECVAISQTADATGRFFLYYFSFEDFTQTIDLFNDYPKIGIWPDAYYFSYNGFSSSQSNATFAGGILCALDRASMLNGAATLRGAPGPGTPAGENQVCFNLGQFDGGLLPSDLDGATPPPSGSPGYFLEWVDTSDLGLWKFHVDFNTLTNSTLNGVAWQTPVGPNPSTLSPILIPVTTFVQTTCPPKASTTCVPQSGTSQLLDTLSDRLMFRLAYRNFGTHESLVTNHTVTAGGGQAGVRWYEIQDPNGVPNVVQTGTWAPDSSWRWMASAAMDRFGNLAIGYSVSSSSLNPGIRYAARFSSDTPGTLGNETSLIAGTGSQTTTLGRWGDYSALSVDPQDDCTFWYTNEYLTADGTFNWQTRIGSFKLAQCQSTPSNTSVTPDSGAGNVQTFSFLYSDSGGAALITTAQGLFNASNSLSSACAFQYNKAGNTLQIYQDNGSLNPTAITPGTAGTLSNSQCSINVGSSSAGSVGNSLVVNVAVTFTTPGFDGTKNIYMKVSDSNGTTVGFQPLGSWTVQ